MKPFAPPIAHVAIPWTDDFLACGITEIDAQHRKLVGLTNAVAIGFRIQSPELVETTLSQLRSHVCEHFEAEERWMQSLGYATFAEHVREHHKIRQCVDDLWNCRATLSPEALFRTLAEWITQHISLESSELRLIALCN